jgi:hypothetical protein
MERKIFVLSLHRTGTQSVHDLFVRLGIRAIHWPKIVDGVDYQSRIIGRENDPAFIVDVLAPVFARATALSDVPIPALYRVLDARFRGAQFIAVRRDASGWIRSVRRHIGERPFNPFEKAQYFPYFADLPERITSVPDNDLIEMHRRHYEALAKFFVLRVNFALFELNDPRLGPRICEFLGRPPMELRHVDTTRRGLNSVWNQNSPGNPGGH